MKNSALADVYIMAMRKQAESKKRETYPISRMLTNPVFGGITGGLAGGGLAGGLAAMQGASGKAIALLAATAAAGGAGAGALKTLVSRYINARARDPEGSALMKLLWYFQDPLMDAIQADAYKGRKAMGTLMEFER